MTPKNAQLAATIESDPRWAAVVARDPGADGAFYYSVRTTGVYCRPSCAARRARPENISFHTTREGAEKAGLRPCKRCKLDQPPLAERHAAKVTKACRLIEESESTPSLQELARHAGLSAYHFHRVFKAVTGLTPKEYAMAQRAKRVRNELGQSETVAKAVYKAGYSSNRRFYETSNEMLGMTPSSWRAGGTSTKIRFAVGECSLGSILVAQSERGVCAILLGDDPDGLVRDLQDRFPAPALSAAMQDLSSLSQKWSALSRRRRSGSTCRGTSGARRSSDAYGRRCAKSRPALRQVMPTLQAASDPRTRSGRLPMHALPTPSQWPSRVIAW